MESTNKTDLSRILSVSGHGGLFRYIAQARNGAVVESLKDGSRTCFDSKSRITTLADISIYTNDGELRLREVFDKLHAVLGDNDAPTQKAPADELKKLFAEAVPDYDGDRFYVSHMKKVVEWYNCLKNFATLDFMTDEEIEAAAKEEQEK